MFSCAKEKKSEVSQTEAPATTTAPAVADTTRKITFPPPPKSDREYVLDRQQNLIFEIDLNLNKISRHIVPDDSIVAIAYDAAKEWIYEAIGKPKLGLKIFDAKNGAMVKTFEFADPTSDMLFDPIKRRLYLVSEDSTFLRSFSPDSMKFLWADLMIVVNMGKVGPKALNPGPLDKIITANGKRGSLSQIFTESEYGYQTITIHDAQSIDAAAFAIDGNSGFACDSKQGKIYHVQFGTGNPMGLKSGLDNPRSLQLEVNSNRLAVVVGKTEVLMLHPDTFAELGKVDLSPYGAEILKLVIPPKANFAEVTMDYKGVTRWMRFDINSWQLMRMVELI